MTRYRVGDRVTWLCPDRQQLVRLVGTITGSDPLTFDVQWDLGLGAARFVHGGEPDTFRAATGHDEREAVTATVRNAVASELRRLADTHPQWAPAVRHVLVRRAADFTGSLT